MGYNVAMSSPARSTDPPRRERRPRKDSVRGRVRAHDPFELIRWLAFSQPDPRKALAELVQNSLDAGAHRIRVTRGRERGIVCLRIFDDGDGVIPEMERQEALGYIATHIGHSRKRSLSPQERYQLMTQGQYGIGLLGFWSLGHKLELRSAVPGQRPHRLILHREDPHYEIEPLHGRLPLEERWTEVVVGGLHPEAQSALIGRRAADYLASELRGQLLARDVQLVVEDRLSRGRAQKILQVKPPQFLGERIVGLSTLEVPGHAPVRLEIYFSGAGLDAGELRGIAVYSAGTLVANGFQELAALGLDRAPWTDLRLTGLVDFPDFHVAPGSRHGVIVDEAANAFASAIATVEPLLDDLLESLERRRSERLDRNLVRDLQRAFRDFYRQRPRYSMLPVHEDEDRGAGPDAGDGACDGEAMSREPKIGTRDEVGPEIEDFDLPPLQGELLPPGALARVRIAPARVRVECSGTRRVRAVALDANERVIEDGVHFAWRLAGDAGWLDADAEDAARVLFRAGDFPAAGTLEVTARAGVSEAFAAVPVEVVDEIASRRSPEGIPEPEFVDQPGAAWRSRMEDERWQVNSGHRDFVAIVDRPQLKLRYLAMLFAKEVVLRSHNDPRFVEPLEQLIEVAAFADRNLANRNRKLRGSAGRDGDA
jgi:hypothetical protein